MTGLVVLRLELLLSEPLVERDLSELRVRAGDQRLFAQPHAVVGRLVVGDNLAGVAFGREPFAHQFVQPELFGPADLTDSVRRLSYRDAADRSGDVVGGHWLDQRRTTGGPCRRPC